VDAKTLAGLNVVRIKTGVCSLPVQEGKNSMLKKEESYRPYGVVERNNGRLWAGRQGKRKTRKFEGSGKRQRKGDKKEFSITGRPVGRKDCRPKHIDASGAVERRPYFRGDRGCSECKKKDEPFTKSENSEKKMILVHGLESEKGNKIDAKNARRVFS